MQSPVDDHDQEPRPLREAEPSRWGSQAESWWDSRAGESLAVAGILAVVAGLFLGVGWVVAAAYHRWVGPTPNWWGAFVDWFRFTTFALIIGPTLWKEWRRATPARAQPTADAEAANAAGLSTEAEAGPGTGTASRGGAASPDGGRRDRRACR
ncbi:MAG TPA: hypothetical protein VFP72_21290 [Kineosporiaceae bacterium]|nr:hypothetical protein [Kineosporiaceae bacterium]